VRVQTLASGLGPIRCPAGLNGLLRGLLSRALPGIPGPWFDRPRGGAGSWAMDAHRPQWIWGLLPAVGFPKNLLLPRLALGGAWNSKLKARTPLSGGDLRPDHPWVPHEGPGPSSPAGRLYMLGMRWPLQRVLTPRSLWGAIGLHGG